MGGSCELDHTCSRGRGTKAVRQENRRSLRIELLLVSSVAIWQLLGATIGRSSASLLMGSPAALASADVAASYRSVAVEVRNDLPDMVRLGSGTIIEVDGSHAVVLTAWHIFENEKTHEVECGDVTIHTASGEDHTAILCHKSGDYDLCLFKIPAPKQPDMGVDLCELNVAPEVTLVGFKGEGRIHTHAGPLLKPYNDYAVPYSFRIDLGDSGSGAFNHGRFAGVGIGYYEGDEKSSRVIPISKVKEFLAEPGCIRWLKRLRDQIEQQAAPNVQ